MIYYGIKVLVSALIIVLVAEIAKRSTFLGAMLASLPLTSLLAFIWLYLDTGNLEKVASLSVSIFWFVIPSLVLLLLIPLLIKWGYGFWFSLLSASCATIICYALMVWVLRQAHIEL